MNQKTIALTLFAVACLTSFGVGGNVDVVQSFPANIGPGWKESIDVAGAVGPRHVVALDVAGFVVHDKASGEVLQQLSTQEFWERVEPAGTQVPQENANDARIIYDPLSERWFACAAGTTEPDCFLAVSSTSNPLETWNGAKLPLPRINPYMKLGVDRNGLYVCSCNGNPDMSQGTNCYVLPKEDAIADGGPVLTRGQTFTNLQFSTMPALDPDPDKPADAPMILLSNQFFDGVCSELYMYKVTWSDGTAGISEALTIPLSQDYLTPNNTTPAMEAFQPAPGPKLRAGGGGRRLDSVFVRDGSVFGCNGANRRADSRPGVLWYEVRISDGALIQEGFVDSPDRDFIYPSIAVDSRGNIGIGCTGTSQTEFPSVCVMMHGANDPAGTMRDPVQAVPGTTAYHYEGQRSVNWSHYSATCIDPSNPDLLWTLQAYGNSEVDREWCTAWAAFRLADVERSEDDEASAIPVHQDVFGQSQSLPIGITAKAFQDFTGEKTSWHGFDRFDFLLDETALTVTPFQASADEGTGVTRHVEGQLRCIVVVPKEPAHGKPWSWRGRYFDHEPQSEIELLERGFHIGFIQSDDIRHWNAWYEFLTEEYGLSRMPAFVGMSGGGRNAFTWATTYPDRVSCIYADNPLITRDSLMELDELVRRDVPLLHICGSLDPLSVNHTFPIESLYQQLGGRISVMIKDGVGHHPHSLRDPTLIADFITDSLDPSPPVPAFVGQEFTKSSFYGVENRYSEFPAEDMHITCRGALFSETFSQYEFKPDCTSGNVHVIVPRTAAPGKPWVMRANPALREAVVDLALLEKGFHIVRAPRPRDPSVTQMQEWQAFYEYLVEHGFSSKPVMEGAGGAAGEVYEWAIANANNVSCIYCENPLLRHYTSQTQPLDHLAPLAEAGVPILHLCGSLDPWLESQTRVAEKRYQQLGGRITVMINEGEGHYPLAPHDPQPVVEFIHDSVAAHASN